jgi:hypothetical protein
MKEIKKILFEIIMGNILLIILIIIPLFVNIYTSYKFGVIPAKLFRIDFVIGICLSIILFTLIVSLLVSLLLKVVKTRYSMKDSFLITFVVIYILISFFIYQGNRYQTVTLSGSKNFNNLCTNQLLPLIHYNKCSSGGLLKGLSYGKEGIIDIGLAYSLEKNLDLVGAYPIIWAEEFADRQFVDIIDRDYCCLIK